MALAAESDDKAQWPVKSAAYVVLTVNADMAIAHTKIFMLWNRVMRRAAV